MLFSRKPKNEDDATLEENIQDTLNRLITEDKASETAEELITKLERLYKLKNSDKSSQRISPDAWLAAGVSIASILLVVNAEHVGAVTSKAFSLMHKPKL